MSKFNPGNLAVGDIVQTRRTMRVDMADHGSFKMTDVASRQGFYFLHDSEQGTLRIAMVKRAARPKPKAGDVIDGRTLKAVQWKRGTVVRADEAIAVLLEAGDWRGTDPGGCTWRWEFESVNDGEKFEVLYVA